MGNERIRRLALGGLLAALVLLLTYLVKLPVPATGGYVHAGDGAIFLAAILLGPYAALVGAIGSALADLLGGYFVYALPTFAIKAAMGWLAGAFARAESLPRRLLVFILAECLMVGGYFFFEGFLYGWAAALAAVGPNVVQGIAGVMLGLAFAALPLERIMRVAE